MEAEQALGALTANAGFLLSRVGAAVQGGFKELLSGWGIRPQQFAERRRDPRDRRRYLLAVTAEGQAAFEAMRAATASYTGSFLEPLSQAEQETLVGALAKLYAATPEGRRWPRPEPARRP